jgi:hypothetical protein
VLAFKLIFGFMFGILCVAIVFTIIDHPASLRRALSTPCKEYQQRPLSEVPARCITPQGGFKP